MASTARATWWVGCGRTPRAARRRAAGSGAAAGAGAVVRELLELRKDLRVLAKANINLDSLKADRLHDNPEELEAFTYGLTRHGDPSRVERLRQQEARRRRRVLAQHVMPFAAVSLERDSAFAGTVKLRTLLLHCDPRSVSQDGWPPCTVRTGGRTA